jgi:hypothetical protein
MGATDALGQFLSNSFPWKKPWNNCSYPDKALPTERKKKLQRDGC